MLCGSSCVKYILNRYNKSYIKINESMKWITQLALSLKENGLSVRINCYKSNLYEDYKLNNNENLTFDGFLYINEVLNKNIPLLEKKLNYEILKKEIRENEFIILCVKSSIFNSNEDMNGGHFIILSKLNYNDQVAIINPIKDKYEIRNVSLDFLLSATINYGSWRILIKEEK